MFSESILEKFSLLVLKKGVSLQNGQGLEILCPVEQFKVAEKMTEVAYKLGAKIVNIRWNSDNIDKLKYTYSNTETLKDIPKWYIESKNYLVKHNFCYVAIASEDPTIFKDIPAEKISAVENAKSKLLKSFSDCVMKNGIRWCVVSVPTFSWAKQVFPTSKNPEQDLTEAIELSMRLDSDDVISEWDKHIKRLSRHAEMLNNLNLEYLHFENSLGTDIMIGLAVNYQFLSAEEKAQDGIKFIANMPTEEVFTAPHKDKVFGTVKSALPLSYNGQIVDGFSITFKNGKIIDYSATTGYETLKHLIETDNGTKRLGEVALIGKNSPIAKSNVLFFNTLFDENASCHLALGKGYPTTIKGGDTMDKKSLLKFGVNDSVEHVDFMIGTPDLKITGIGYDKKETPIFINGEWID